MTTAYSLLAINTLLLLWNVALCAWNLKRGSSWVWLNAGAITVNVIAVGVCLRSLRLRREIERLRRLRDPLR